MKKTNYTLIETYNKYSENEYENYLEYCKMEFEVPTDEGFVLWKDSDMEFELENFWEDIMDYKPNCSHFLINGVLGLWDGKHEIEEVCEDSLYKAIKRCLSSDIAYFSVEKKGDTILISATHHDGTNNFSIVGLSEKGEDIYERRGKVSLKVKSNVLELPNYFQ